MKERITHVRRDNQGRVIEFKTDKNNIYDVEVTKEYITNNRIENALVDLTTMPGISIINSIEKDNFLNYPEF